MGGRGGGHPPTLAIPGSLPHAQACRLLSMIECSERLERGDARPGSIPFLSALLFDGAVLELKSALGLCPTPSSRLSPFSKPVRSVLQLAKVLSRVKGSRAYRSKGKTQTRASQSKSDARPQRLRRRRRPRRTTSGWNAIGEYYTGNKEDVMARGEDES